MTNRTRAIRLTSISLVLAAILIFSVSITISSRIALASGKMPHNTCSRGAGCGHQYPGGLSSNLGSCTANSTSYGTSTIVDNSGTVQGQIGLYYNHNCDVWFGAISSLTGSADLDTTVNNEVESVFHFFPATAGTFTFTIYDGASRTTVFTCAMVNPTQSFLFAGLGCVHN